MTDATSGSDPPLADEARNLFAAGKYADALVVLEDLRRTNADDPKVLHNIAVTEYCMGGFTDAKALLAALAHVRQRSEELARVAEEQLEGSGGSSGTTSQPSSPDDSDKPTPLPPPGEGGQEDAGVTAQVGAGEGGADGGTSGPAGPGQAPAGGAGAEGGALSKAPAVAFMEEYDVSLASLNMAVILYQQQQLEEAAAALEPLYRQIEPLEEGTALRVCLLLLEIWIEVRAVDKARGVVAYLEKAFGHVLVPDKDEEEEAKLGGGGRGDEGGGGAIQASAGGAGDAGKASTSTAVSVGWAGLSKVARGEIRLRLHVMRGRLALLRGNTKAAEHEIECVKSLAQALSAPQWAMTQVKLLQAELHHLRGEHPSAAKALAGCCTGGGAGAGQSPALLNNMGCVLHSLGKHATAAMQFSRAMAASGGGGGGYDRRRAVLYNAGLQHLLAGSHELALSCFQEAAALYHKDPLLWLRIAECCIGWHCSRGGGGGRGADASTRIEVVGAPEAQRLVLPAGRGARVGEEAGGSGGAAAEGSDDDWEPSLELGAQCLDNALFLLGEDKAPAEEEGGGERGRGGGAPAEGAGEGGSAAAGGRAASPAGAAAPAGAEAEATGGRDLEAEAASTRAAVLANNAYLWLLLNHPLAALKSARALLAMPASRLSRESAFLGHSYAAEALCMMGNAAEAAEHLSTCLVASLQEDEAGGGQQQDGAGDKGGGAGGGALSGRGARAALYVNLAAVYATQGELGQAQQCSQQALALEPNNRHALLSLVYVELARGDSAGALKLLKTAQPNLTFGEGGG